MIVEYRLGAVGIIAGDVGRAGLLVGILPPWENAVEEIATGGSKAEHGPGGFEVLAPHPAAGYRVRVGSEWWRFDHRGGMTFLRIDPDEEPEPVPGPEPPSPDPEPRPVPVPEGRWAELFARLDRIIEGLEGRL